MKSDLDYVECSVCGSKNFKLIIKQKNIGYNLNLVICKNCSLGLLNPRWTKEKYANYYKEEYDKQYRPNIQSEKEKDICPNPILERFKNNNIDILRFKNILDIGGGSGDNLMAFKRNNSEIKCFAIEPSIKAQKNLTQKGVQIISDDVDTHWEANFAEKFDVVIMRHVLEHFLRPLEVLKKVQQVLSENGILYIAVPNNLLEKRSAGWLRIAHTYYFNKYTLSKILNKSSLSIQALYLEDKYNRFEIFAFAKKGLVNLDIQVNKKVIKSQEKAFKSALKIKSYFTVFKNTFNSIFR
ncbi:Methyltransferase domain-containing protein [Flaviramulus basaltis]|uniref:Methyltransferase domain-containing protein n=1 Tax=Flaviramulus basaltis TaxID=369401 RepID=A0A1K2IMS2_9FLAO|nr:class I SAM-dependent methyltransferase [Flaviramulus basaltis]SFZ92971.1 Methyltransferase domain-containing protein [Flaviramulus basaltis]